MGPSKLSMSVILDTMVTNLAKARALAKAGCPSQPHLEPGPELNMYVCVHAQGMKSFA